MKKTNLFALGMAIGLLHSGSSFGQAIEPARSTEHSVEASVTLPATIESARTPNPPCGGKVEDVDAIAAAFAIDKIFFGVPVVSTAVLFNSANANWLKERLGIHNGPASCATLCVALPNNATDVYVQGCIDEVNSDGQHTGNQICRDTGAKPGKNWSTFYEVTQSRDNKKWLLCTHVKQWKHNADRQAKLVVDYNSK